MSAFRPMLALRGFNGDIAQRLRHWRGALDNQHPAVLGRAIARKTLFAVAGLVSATRRMTCVLPNQRVDPELDS